MGKILPITQKDFIEQCQGSFEDGVIAAMEAVLKSFEEIKKTMPNEKFTIGEVINMINFSMETQIKQSGGSNDKSK